MAGDSLGRGLLANYVGKGFCALLGLLTLPVLYRQLGAEAFGLFGLFFSVQAVLGVFDFGVGAAMQRDLAALDANAKNSRPADVLATLTSIERLLGAIAVAAIALAFVLSPYLTANWLSIAVLPAGVVASALVWIVVAAAFQLMGSFYMGCLNGLRLHAKTNIIQSSVWAVRFALLMVCVKAGVASPGSMSLAVLPVLQAWAAANALLVIWSRVCLKRALPVALEVSGAAYLRKAAQFGLPLVATTTLIMLFNQVDKIAASKLVTLETLGKYTIVWSVAEAIYLMYQPIYTSFLPVFAGRLALAQDSSHVTDLGHSISMAWQMMTVAVLPITIVIFSLSDMVVFAWTGDKLLADGSAGVLRWVITGAAVNAFLFIPFALQQALGNMRPWMWRIMLALAVYAPLAIAAINRWGMVGAAAAWCTGSACLALWLASATTQSLRQNGVKNIGMARLLTGSAKTALVCMAVAGLAALLRWPLERFTSAAFVLCTLAVCMLLAVRSQPAVWRSLSQVLSRLINARATNAAP